MIRVESLERSFSYLGTRFPDPDPSMTVEQVRDVYVNSYPELATAAVEGPSPANGRLEYTFTRALGAKG